MKEKKKIEQDNENLTNNIKKMQEDHEVKLKQKEAYYKEYY